MLCDEITLGEKNECKITTEKKLHIVVLSYKKLAFKTD
jgi:hypothetical protein